MRRCLMLCLFCFCIAGSSFAQNTPALTDTAHAIQPLQHFSVNAPETLLFSRGGALFHGNITPTFSARVLPNVDLCYTMRSYNFSKSETPKKVGESTCTDAKLVRLKPVDQNLEPQDNINALKK
ncbi:MAG: hypothetical protein JWO13_2315 [Acidobacteriales bacterium]|nr:hypothetical protein [Terriglobales bacterium]